MDVERIKSLSISFTHAVNKKRNSWWICCFKKEYL